MKQIILDSEIFENIFKSLKESMSRDMSRPILKWIKVEVEEKKITAVSLDGYMMTNVCFEFEEIKSDEKFSFFIQPFNIPKTKYGCEIIVNCEDKKFTEISVKPYAEQSMVTYKILQPESEFIAWKKVIPVTEKKFEISFDANKLMRLLKGYVGYTKDNLVTLKFVKKEDGIDKLNAMVLEQTNVKGIRKESIILPMRTID